MIKGSNTALLIIDIQNMYFVGEGRLRNPEDAAENAAKLIRAFRSKNLPIIHIKHKFDTDNMALCAINERVIPLESETIMEKMRPDSFFGTGLAEKLVKLGITELVVAGMMSHMCVDTTVRTAYNMGYKVILADDACADRSLQYYGLDVSAENSHNAFMAALGEAFAKLMKTEDIINGGII